MRRKILPAFAFGTMPKKYFCETKKKSMGWLIFIAQSTGICIIGHISLSLLYTN